MDFLLFSHKLLFYKQSYKMIEEFTDLVIRFINFLPINNNVIYLLIKFF